MNIRKSSKPDLSVSGLTGSHIREQRVRAGIKQAELAQLVGISPAYLNLIEHNRRRIGGKVLMDLAKVLDVDVATLTQGAESALLEGLQDAAATARMWGQGADSQPAETEQAEEFAGRFPGWAKLILQQREKINDLDRRVEMLNDRLSHDPFLSSALHEVLSVVTAIRSTAGILNGPDEIDRDWQARFHRNMYEDSQRLAEGAQALVQYLDTIGSVDEAQHAPLDELEAWVRSEYSNEINQSDEKDAQAGDAARLTTPAAQDHARRWAARAQRDAAQMPVDLVRSVVAQTGPDPAALALQAQTDIAAAMRRLATLPPVEKEQGPASFSFGLLICDGSGTLTFRKPLDGFAPPRLGASCPLWPLYQSLLRPMVPVRRIVEQSGASDRSYLAYAIAQPAVQTGYDAPEIMEATMLFMALDEVTALAPQLLVGLGSERLEIGTSCQVCAHQNCAARRESSLML